MKYVIGIDGGGTKTRGLLVQEDGRVIKDRLGEASNYHTYGIEYTKESLSKLLNDLLTDVSRSDISYCYLGLSGADREEDFDTLYEALNPLFSDIPFVIENDTWCVLQSAFAQNWGAVSIYGTGANAGAAGKNGQKEILRALTYVAGGYGGGYDLTMTALHYAYRSNEETYTKTSLEKGLSTLLDVPTLDHAVPLIFPNMIIPYETLLKIPPLVFEHAKNGDTVSIEILEHYGTVQGQMVAGVIKRADLHHEKVPVVLGGSIYNGVTNHFVDAMMAELQKTAPLAYSVKPKLPPVVGAVISAMNHLNWPVDYPLFESQF